MNVDKSAAFLYVVVVWVTVSRSTNDEQSMDDDKARQQSSDVTTHNLLLRHRPRSISHRTTVSTKPTGDTSDYTKERHHVAYFDFSYVAMPFVSLWAVLSDIVTLGELELRQELIFMKANDLFAL